MQKTAQVRFLRSCKINSARELAAYESASKRVLPEDDRIDLRFAGHELQDAAGDHNFSKPLKTESHDSISWAINLLPVTPLDQLDLHKVVDLLSQDIGPSGILSSYGEFTAVE